MTALRLAHRGDWRAAPENTIAAFQAALRVDGCDGVELDVRQAADGAAIVLHDETFERVQGVAARASDLTSAQAAALGVPTLAEVFVALGDRPFVDVELKEWMPTALDVLEQARAAGERLERTVVSSFEIGVHKGLQRSRPAWRRWLNTVALDERVIDRALDLGCAGIAGLWRNVDQRTAGLVRAANLELAAWTVTRRSTYRRLEQLELVAICAEAAALDG